MTAMIETPAPAAGFNGVLQGNNMALDSTAEKLQPIKAPAPVLTRKTSGQVGMLPKLKTRRSNNASNNSAAGEGGETDMGIKSVHVDNSDAAAFPSPFSHQADTTPDSPSNARSGMGQVQHMMPFTPYMLYPVASPVTYPMAESGSPHAGTGTLSPLMGSPVGTPTAMMFPTTPFAGANPNPFYNGGYGAPEAPLSPHASGRVNYFHPMFNNFPFMGLQSLASIPLPPGTVPLACHPSMTQPMPVPMPQSKPAENPTAAVMASIGGASIGNNEFIPSNDSDNQQFANNSFADHSPYGAMGMNTSHMNAAQAEHDNDSGLPNPYFKDAGNMFNQVPMQTLPFTYLDLQRVLAAQQQAALAQLTLQQQINGMFGNAAFAMPNVASSPATGMPQMPAWPGSPALNNLPVQAMNTGLPNAGLDSMNWSDAMSAHANLNTATMLGLNTQNNMMTANDMYANLQFQRNPDPMAAALLAQQRKLSRFGLPAGLGRVQTGNPMGGYGAGMPQMNNMVHLSTMHGLPHIATSGAPKSPRHSHGFYSSAGRRHGGSVGSSGNLTPQTRTRNNTAGGAPDSARLGADGLPRLNARQRRTLRRAKERAIKGLMEAGSLLLQRVAGSAGAGPGSNGAASQGGSAQSVTSAAAFHEDDKQGYDDEPTSAGSASTDAQSTSFYIHAAMQVAGGSHGPQAAADASNALNKVAAELEEMDLGDLISQLARKDEPGGASVDDALVRDLQIIQNLMGALRSPSLAHATATKMTVAPVA